MEDKKNIKEKLSPEFDDLIKSLQFPDKFYNILDKISHDEFNRGYGIGSENEKIVILHKIDKLDTYRWDEETKEWYPDDSSAFIDREELKKNINPTQNIKETSSKQSLGESEVRNNQHQVEGSEATSVSLAGDEEVVKNETNSPVNIIFQKLREYILRRQEDGGLEFYTKDFKRRQSPEFTTNQLIIFIDNLAEELHSEVKHG